MIEYPRKWRVLEKSSSRPLSAWAWTNLCSKFTFWTSLTAMWWTYSIILYLTPCWLLHISDPPRWHFFLPSVHGALTVTKNLKLKVNNVASIICDVMFLIISRAKPQLLAHGYVLPTALLLQSTLSFSTVEPQDTISSGRWPTLCIILTSFPA